MKNLVIPTFVPLLVIVDGKNPKLLPPDSPESQIMLKTPIKYCPTACSNGYLLKGEADFGTSDLPCCRNDIKIFSITLSLEGGNYRKEWKRIWRWQCLFYDL